MASLRFLQTSRLPAALFSRTELNLIKQPHMRHCRTGDERLVLLTLTTIAIAAAMFGAAGALTAQEARPSFEVASIKPRAFAPGLMGVGG